MDMSTKTESKEKEVTQGFPLMIPVSPPGAKVQCHLTLAYFKTTTASTKIVGETDEYRQKWIKYMQNTYSNLMKDCGADTSRLTHVDVRGNHDEPLVDRMDWLQAQ